MLCNDILLSIFEFLNYFTRVECSLVCKNWHHLTDYSLKHNNDTEKLISYFKLHSQVEWDDQLSPLVGTRLRCVFDYEVGIGLLVDTNNIFIITPFHKFLKFYEFKLETLQMNDIHIHHLNSSKRFVVHLTKQPSATIIIDYHDTKNIKLDILFDKDCSARLLRDYNIKCQICETFSISSQDNIPVQLYKHTQNYCLYYFPSVYYHFWKFYDSNLKIWDTFINHLVFLLLPDGKILIQRDAWIIVSDDESEKETVHISCKLFDKEIINHYYGYGSNVIGLGKHGYLISTTDYTNHFVLLRKQRGWVLESLNLDNNNQTPLSFYCPKSNKIYFFGLNNNVMISYDVNKLILKE